MSAKEVGPGKLAPAAARRGALKRADGQPLTRHDLQYDVLSYIFNDENAVFTDPFSSPPGEKVTFRDLYVSAIVRAPKTARSVRDKIAESSAFATDFAMLSLLANVGRVNTSMAFFPETRTALRTYHPVPALQRTDGNLTDAPRIRNALKSCTLPSESKHVPTSPFNILALRDTGPFPTTSVFNLLFVLTQHTAGIGTSHFNEDAGLEFTDLFQPVPVPSAERGRAFLWVVFHYLESAATPNPFSDPPPEEGDSSSESKDIRPMAPRMHRVDPSMLVNENVDLPEEKEYGEKMSEHRRQFLETDRERQEAVNAAKVDGTDGPPGSSERGASGTPAPVAGTSISIKSKGKSGRKAAPEFVDASSGYMKFSYKDRQNDKPALQLQPDGPLTLAPSASAGTAYDNSHRQSTGTGRGKKSKRGMQTEPYDFVYAPPSPERSMFQQAWHIINTKDVLYDSDDESADQHVRLDYIRRLQTLSRLRGKSPTPTPEPDAHPHAGEVLGVDPLVHPPPPEVEFQHHHVAPPEMDVDDSW
ncbi:uncharacterized protein FOMMEDRAFT_149067 [Fomitiporia mediterranea MF3/22]|uniref:uncharacterized protein n=1 Tax=Fomitiporia mediterranea (strain MF3/22) TaxID=694068 RepID=UPI0004408FD1|nr:uncharacterized protein FOMMEDRAFT_149067 [Fomitiporia mediterranea MF3/22]EJC98698.1 hypothetical protein FOMMEDRAFT_149067 [Fomitiporia mediterranea MF3/22]